MTTSPTGYVNSPPSGTQEWSAEWCGCVVAGGDTISAHVECWSGANGTGSLVAVTTLDLWVWDQTSNASAGHFSGGPFNSATANATTVTAGHRYKVSAKWSGGTAPGSFKMWMVYSSSSAYYPASFTFSPGAGGVGTVVTLTGSQFTDATTADVNGVSASFSVSSDTSATVTIPSGATSGPIHLGNPAGSRASSTNLLVANGYVLRSGVWTPGVVDLHRSGVDTTAQGVEVLRSSVWTPSQ